MMDCFLQLINGNWSSIPLVAMIMFFVIEVVHRKDISNLINRINRIKVYNAGLEFSGSSKQREVTESQVFSGEEKEGQGDNYGIKKIDGDNQYYELAKQELIFEKIYNVIFRSQIQMMQEIKRNNNQPMPYQYSFNYFQYHLSFMPASNWANENPAIYFQWLVNSNLIRGVEGGYILTSLGERFLEYIYNNNYDINLKIL